MAEFILRRLGQSTLVLFIMSLLVFGGVNLVGDPVEMLINPEADQAEVERVISELGLDKPVTEQYWYFLKKLVNLCKRSQKMRQRAVLGR